LLITILCSCISLLPKVGLLSRLALLFCTKIIKLQMENNDLIKHSGGCHCGAIRFTAVASSKVTVYICKTILDRVLGARAAGVHYRLFSVWTLVPVRLDQQLSDHSTVDEIASGAADCRLTYTMANCPQRR
ncbi:hypothetical protein TNCV_3509731, partial [Trichonephila clavipes]